MRVDTLAFRLLYVATVILWGTVAAAEPERVAEILNTELGSSGTMPALLRVAITTIVLVAVPAAIWSWLHNSLVNKEEAVLGSWAQVESNYQRRADLVPQLVEAISRYLKHEESTLVEVTTERTQGHSEISNALRDVETAQQNSRSSLAAHAGKPPAEDSELEALTRAQDHLTSEMQRVFALAENYPNLKAGDQFITLQAQLEGTENRINVARMRFNEAVQDYNRSLRTLPSSVVADSGGFRRKAYFKAQAGADKAQRLQFDE